MQADWEFEVAPDAPIIDAAWEGLIDLRAAPARIREIAEIALLPGLAGALVRLNGPASPVWTSKCDVWIPETFDPDELDSPANASACALACYIDLLACAPSDWSGPAPLEAFCRSACATLRVVTLRCCRADLVVRRAVFQQGREALGITAYLAACGPSTYRARSALDSALAAFVDSVCALSAGQSAGESLQ